MPRLPPSLVIRAAHESKHLPALLTECRDLPSARNELRWLAKHARSAVNHGDAYSSRSRIRRPQAAELLSNLVRRRSRGEPLQYILGDQPFGNLEILCQPKVLIPRPETELYTTNVAACLANLRGHGTPLNRGGLRILDLCTGSGCIALLLHSLLRSKAEDSTLKLQIAGLDISQNALQLAKKNKTHNISSQSLAPAAENEVSFHPANVLELLHTTSADTHPTAPADRNLSKPFSSALVEAPSWRQDGSWDVVISNPPYISEADFALGGTTIESVRKFEPKLALVPPTDPSDSADHGDIFYKHIIQIGRHLGARLIVLEVGDSDQAWRVCKLAKYLLKDQLERCAIELWRDDGSVKTDMEDQNVQDHRMMGPLSNVVERAVVIWMQDWATWRKSTRHGYGRDEQLYGANIGNF